MKHVILQLTLMLGGLAYAALAPIQTTNSVHAVGPTVRAAQVNMETKSRRATGPDYDLFGPATAPDPGAGKPAQPTPPTPETPRAPKPAPKVEIVYFTATWCGPCQSQKPILAQLTKEGYKIVYIDVDQNPAMKAQYGVRTIPVLVIERNGKEVKRFTGVTNKATLKNAAKAALESG